MIEIPAFTAPAAPVGTIARQSCHLTPRQVEILRLASHGAMHKHMTDALGIAMGTVKCHSREAIRAIGARTMAHAVAIAIRKGIL